MVNAHFLVSTGCWFLFGISEHQIVQFRLHRNLFELVRQTGDEDNTIRLFGRRPHVVLFFLEQFSPLRIFDEFLNETLILKNFMSDSFLTDVYF